MDMGCVEQKGLDISHTVACDVLQIPCQNGLVEGVKVQVRANQKSKRDPNITLEHKIEIEHLLRRQDCGYAHYIATLCGKTAVVPNLLPSARAQPFC